MRTGCGMDGEGSARARGARRKFIKLRSSCPEPSRSNWKNLVFRLSTWRGYRQISPRHISPRDVKSGSAALILFRARFVDRFIADKTISARKSHDKRWNRGNYHAISIIRTNSVTTDMYAGICVHIHMYIRNYHGCLELNAGMQFFLFQKLATSTASRAGAYRRSCHRRWRSGIFRSVENRLSRDEGSRRHTE